MLSSTKKKRGRPTAVHRMADGTSVPGLLRRADGRWKISATGQTFVERDENIAVARFKETIAKLSPKTNLGVPRGHATFAEAFDDVMNRSAQVGGSIKAEVWPSTENNDTFIVTDNHLSPGQWAWIREQFLSRAPWVAQQVGLQQLAWFTDLKEPKAPMKLAMLVEIYTAKPGLSANEVGRTKLFWKQFTKAVEVTSIGEVDHDAVARYEKVVLSGGLSPKSVLHRFSKIKTVVAYGMKRGRGVEDCRRALDALAMLEVKNAHTLDPLPISPTDFWKIHAAAIKADDKIFAAMMLVALNMGAYAGEVSALRWEEIDLKSGDLATRRPKTGVSRFAVLWPEALKALKQVSRGNSDHVFNTRVRSYTVFSVLAKWRVYRTAAGVKDNVVFGQIRDASYTIASRTTSLDQARVLAGHRLPGAADNYIKRNPAFVTDACAAIRKVFFTGKSKM